MAGLFTISPMNFELDPPQGVGPLRIGMPQTDANAALEQLRDADAPSTADAQGTRVVRASGLIVAIDCVRERLDAVELWRPASDADTVKFRGIDVFNLPSRELIARLREHIAIEPDEDDPASFCSPELVLSLWRPFDGDDEPHEEQGFYFDSVLVAAPGYYDTPAQAAERASRAGGLLR